MTSQGARTRPRADPQAGRRTERVLAAERRIAFVAHLLDDLVAVPGTRSRVGLDPIIGLIPFVGDFIGSLLGTWIVLEAARFRLPGVVMVRMMLNVLVDFVVGLLPLLGDLFDAGFKANTRNLELFHVHGTDPGADTSRHAAFLAGILLILAGVAWAMAVVVGRLLAAVFGW